MAEGAIIFLLKVVYFSIERWCTFGLTNTQIIVIIKLNNKFISTKDNINSFFKFMNKILVTISISSQKFRKFLLNI